jgi:hypothetical protein
MADPLSPEEMKALFGDSGDAGAPNAPSPTPAPAPAPAPQILTPEQHRALFGDPAPAAPGASPAAAPAAPPVAPSDALESFQASTLSGIGDVAGGIQRLFGFAPTLSTATQNKLTAEQKAGMTAHPWAATGGRMLGQTAATLPATLATAYALPEAGAATLPTFIARGGYIGGLTGAENALLTSGQNPEEPLPQRALHGALWGVPFGMFGGWAENAAGAGQTIPANVQGAGQRMQGAGIDVEPGNLSRTGAPANTRGGPPTIPQAGQINQGWGRIFGEDTPDFSSQTTQTLIPKLGQDVGNAVRAGKIDYDIPLANGTHPGQTFEQRLAEIEADNSGVPAIKRIISGPGGILAKVGPNGEIAGADLGDLLKTYNPLDSATRSRIPQISEPANQIEAALHDAFGQSSTPGQATAYSLAREKYKLALAGENAADPVTGNIDPSKLITVVQRMYPDAKRLGSGPSLSDQGVQFARDAAQIYGGAQSAAPALSRGGWLLPAAASLGSAAAELAPHFLPVALPSAFSNPLITAAGIGLPLAIRSGLGALRTYQNTPGFASNLLMRGSQPGAPYLAATGGPIGSSLSNQQW